VQPGIELALGDVTDADCVEAACKGARGIFHLVGIVEHSRAAADKVYKVNVGGTGAEHTRTHVHAHVRTRTHVHTLSYTRTHTHTHTRKRTHTHTHTHTHTQSTS